MKKLWPWFVCGMIVLVLASCASGATFANKAAAPVKESGKIGGASSGSSSDKSGEYSYKEEAEISAGDEDFSAPKPAEEYAEKGLPESLPSSKKSESLADSEKGLALVKPDSPSPQTAPKKDEPQPKKPEEPKQGPTVKYLSADDSNSKASPAVVRKMVREGRYVQPSLVRTYEFLNYYRFDYPAAEEGSVRIIPEMRKLPEEGEYSLQIAVRSADKSFSDLPAMNITFAVDVSGSMAGTPIEFAKKFIKSFVSRMRAGDKVSIVSFSGSPELLLNAHTVGDGSAAYLEREVFPRLIPSDVTDLEGGIILAYETAQKNYNYKYMNRVVLISDGGANAGTQTVSVIAKHAEDSDRQGIYLAGIGVGEGFNDGLMDAVTDKGRGAYIFLDSEAEIAKSLSEESFLKNFDLAFKNVRLKMTMPAGWEMTEFHGEQVSSKASEVTPQYLGPNSQMIYHLEVKQRLIAGGDGLKPEEAPEVLGSVFSFEAEYSPIGKPAQKASAEASVADMLKNGKNIAKGDAVTAYAEMFKKITYPLDANREKNLAAYEEAKKDFDAVLIPEKDGDMDEMRELFASYGKIIAKGEWFPGARDTYDSSPDSVLGMDPATVLSVRVDGADPRSAVKGLAQLGSSTRLLPLEGYKFLVLSNGPVWNSVPEGSGSLKDKSFKDPVPSFAGYKPVWEAPDEVFDLHTVSFKLRAPAKAQSFSFDFNFFSAEYPGYVNQDFNDTFYAVIEAPSTNRGKRTNIAFDSRGNSIEVDNNYFQNEFHPIPNTGTGFDRNGSTGWLRCSWPIQGGEEFTLTFSIHDEGDNIYDSLAVIDNFRWNEFAAVGTTDPLN